MRQPPNKKEIFLTTDWRHLLMLNYEIDPAVLAPRVPRGTELDTWGGKTFVSVVGFQFSKTRVMGFSLPWHRNFEEVNLRFYVRRRCGDEVRRGVVFIKEIVRRRLVAAMAQRFYNENFVVLPMTHSIEPTPVDDALQCGTRLQYRWHFGGRWNSARARLHGQPQVPLEASEEAFIAEHYFGYVVGRDGATLEYRVDHVPWRVWPVEEARLDCDAERLYGPQFAPVLAGTPSSAFVAEGSPVVVYRGRRI